MYIYIDVSISNVHLAFPSTILVDLTVHILSDFLLTFLSINAPILSCHSINL